VTKRFMQFKCGARIPVDQKNEGWVLQVPCPRSDEIPGKDPQDRPAGAGALVDRLLLDFCEPCQHKEAVEMLVDTEQVTVVRKRKARKPDAPEEKPVEEATPAPPAPALDLDLSSSAPPPPPSLPSAGDAEPTVALAPFTPQELELQDAGGALLDLSSPEGVPPSPPPLPPSLPSTSIPTDVQVRAHEESGRDAARSVLRAMDVLGSSPGLDLSGLPPLIQGEPSSVMEPATVEAVPLDLLGSDCEAVSVCFEDSGDAILDTDGVVDPLPEVHLCLDLLASPGPDQREQDKEQARPERVVHLTWNTGGPPVMDLPQTLVCEGPMGSVFLDEMPRKPRVQPQGEIPADELDVDVDAVLKGLAGFVGGPSVGGISSHVCTSALCWRAFFLQYVRGLVPTRKKKAFAVGALAHACLAYRYLYGPERQLEPCVAVAQAGAPRMARLVQDIILGYPAELQEEEERRWLILGVEPNLVCWLPPARVNGKQVRIPASARPDLLLHVVEYGEIRWETGKSEGPMTNVHMVDHKFVQNLTYADMEGYAESFQFKFGSCVYIEGGYEEVTGTLKGYILNMAAKRMNPTPDNYFRGRCPYSRGDLAGFYQEQMIPLVTEIYRRLDDASYRGDPGKWPRDNRCCQSGWNTLCDYYPLCTAGMVDNDGTYLDDESHQITVEKLQVAPPERGRVYSRILPTPEGVVEKKKRGPGRPRKEPAAGGTGTGPATEPSARKLLKQTWSRHMRDWVVNSWLLPGVEQPAWSPSLGKARFLTDGNRRSSVEPNLQKALAEVLGASAGTSLEVVVQETSATLTFLAKGIQWGATVQGVSMQGTVTWKQIAAGFCDEWYSAKHLPAVSGEKLLDL